MTQSCTGGLLVLLEEVLNPDRIGPFNAHALDLVMLTKTAGGERSADEYRALLESEGFGKFEFHPIQGSFQFNVMTARKL